MPKTKLALLGKNISHSKSQEMYESLLGRNIDYELVDISDEAIVPSLQELFSVNEGLSITAPYKKFFLDEVVMDEETQRLNAINCIKKDGNQFFGFNTDYLALNYIIQNQFSKMRNVYILGDGSMAHVLICLLNKLAIPFEQFSRKNGDCLEKLDLSQLSKQTLVVNTCSRSFIFNGKISKEVTFFDLNYNFEEHDHLTQVSNYIDGLEMLKLQAKFALEIWSIE
ncbi:hypothetical protein HBN50_15975 [Halobacteriovorax sp. GB3]|uniref:hypothetical protein n=1 Tax=Halobacteriovorax sp. GB3 TaxID=2719615 RepID=UPI0023623741|nr:hypothetical protein [Halobacteriovorax sp. GB3]MDD0854611.1 hypothetical protein [Halobacteriovorax sp. GB3]